MYIYIYIDIYRYIDVQISKCLLTTMGETPLSKEELAEFLAVADQVNRDIDRLIDRFSLDR